VGHGPALGRPVTPGYQDLSSSHNPALTSTHCHTMAAVDASRTFTKSKGVSFPDEAADSGAMGEPAETEENPFRIPSESEMATYRDRERADRSAERERQAHLHVYEKLGNRLRRLRVDDAIGPVDDAELPDLNPARNEKAHDLAIATRDRHIEKEQLQDYIQKKRDMFLVQYALEVKKEEMAKLEMITAREEKELERDEQQLESDEVKFDKFLRENDKNSAEAIKEAEHQTNLKMGKLSEIKSLQAEIATVKSDISKNEDKLKELDQYRSFLDALAPPNWQAKAAAQAKQQAEAAQAEAAAAAAAAQADEAEEGGGDEAEDGASDGNAEASASSGEIPSDGGEASAAEDGGLAAAGEDADNGRPQLYFTKPKQLLDIYAELESHNLSLITNGQETEEALQDLEERIDMEEARMATERKYLELQIDALKTEIRNEEDLAWFARERTSYFSSNNVDHQEKDMDQLNGKVAQVYTVCIGENEANISTLQMLTNIENRLEELFESIAKMPAHKVEEAERAKEKQRRLRAREEKIEQQRLHQEERVRKALQRAQAAPKRQTGRKLVFRSAPPKQKKVNHKKRVMATEEEEEMRFFFS